MALPGLRAPAISGAATTFASSMQGFCHPRGDPVIFLS
jgi:hypothetical protein